FEPDRRRGEQADALVDVAPAGGGADVVTGGQFGVGQVGAQVRDHQGGLGRGSSSRHRVPILARWAVIRCASLSRVLVDTATAAVNFCHWRWGAAVGLASW